jgi:hypothetical protein
VGWAGALTAHAPDVVPRCEAAVDETPRHARDHPRRGHRLAAPPDHAGGEQAARPGLRQADDLLPAVHAAPGRHHRGPRHHDTPRGPAVRAAARRRVPVRDLDRVRAASDPRRAGPGVPDRGAVPAGRRRRARAR